MGEPETVPAVYRQLHELGLRLHAAAKEFDPSREDGGRSSVITSIDSFIRFFLITVGIDKPAALVPLYRLQYDGTGIFSLGCGNFDTAAGIFRDREMERALHLVIELIRDWCLHRLPSECGAPIQKWKLFINPLDEILLELARNSWGLCLGGDGRGRN
jgi:hypothetical protein